MENENLKKAFGLAKKELNEEEIKKFKDMIKSTLEKLEDFKKQKEALEKKIKILRMDIDDFKQGRLDRIEERQKKDPLAEEVSVVKVKKKNGSYEVPIKAVWEVTYGDLVYRSYDSCCVSGYFASNFTTGTYALNTGTIINLR